MKQQILFTLLGILILTTTFSCRTRSIQQTTIAKQLSPEKERQIDYLLIEAARARAKDNSVASIEYLSQVLDQDSTVAVAHYLLGNHASELGALPRAYFHYGQASKIDTTNHEYQLRTALTAGELGQMQHAEQILEKLYIKDKNNTDIPLFLVQVYEQLGKIDQALKLYETIETIFGSNIQVKLQKVKLYVQTGQRTKIDEELNALLKEHPTEANYHLIAAKIAFSIDDYDKANEYIDKGLNIDPDQGELMLQKAEIYEIKGDTLNQLNQLKQAMQSEQLPIEKKLEVLTAYYSKLIQKKLSLDEASALLESLIEHHPHTPEIHNLYGALLIEKNQMEEAIEQYKIAIDLDPAQLSPREYICRIYLSEKNYDKALSSLLAGKKYFEKNPDYYLLLGIVQTLRKEPAAAIDAWKTGLSQVHPDNKDLQTRLLSSMGDNYHQMKEYTLSYECYDKALEINPSSHITLNNYAYFLSLDKKELDKAEKMSLKAIELSPNNPTYLDTYGWILFQKKRYSLAKFYLKSAIIHGGENESTLLEHYGDALYMDGETDEALEYWTKASLLEHESSTLLKKIEQKKYIE